MKKTKPANSTQFISSLPGKIKDGIFLFLGEEEYEKEKAVELLRDRFSPETKIYNYHCDSGELLSAADFILSSDMFTQDKIAVLKNITSVLKKKSDIALLTETLHSVPDRCLVILQTESTKEPATITKMGKDITSVIFWKKFENELSVYISSSLHSHNKKIEADAVQYLLTLTGRNMAKIDDALKNIIYGSNKDTVTIDEISFFVSHSKESSIFECIDSIFMKKNNALIDVDSLLSGDTHELVLLSMISTRLNQIEEWFHLMERGLTKDDALSALGIYPKQRIAFQNSVRLFTPTKIKESLIKLSETEKLLKSGHSSKNILANPITDLIYTILT